MPGGFLRVIFVWFSGSQLYGFPKFQIFSTGSITSSLWPGTSVNLGSKLELKVFFRFFWKNNRDSCHFYIFSMYFLKFENQKPQNALLDNTLRMIYVKFQVSSSICPARNQHEYTKAGSYSGVGGHWTASACVKMRHRRQMLPLSNHSKIIIRAFIGNTEAKNCY